MATDKTNIYAALCKAQKSFKPAIKDTANPFFKSKYADLASIWDACKDALAENDLFVSQSIGNPEGGPVLITKVFHVSGEFIESTCPIICGKQNDPQAFGSAVTYTRRYSLAPLLGLITDDDDGEGAMVRTADKMQSKQQKPTQTAPKEEAATADQIAKIKELLKNDLISPEEETQTLAAIPGMSVAKAAAAIGKIQDTIAKRTTAAA
jgi:hypothetical protein